MGVGVLSLEPHLLLPPLVSRGRTQLLHMQTPTCSAMLLHAYYRPLLGLCCSTFHDCWLHVCSGPAAASSAADVTHDIRGVQTPHFTRPIYVIIQ